MEAPREKSPAELLATPVQFLKGVGPARAEMLERMGLRTAQEVLFYFPRDYQQMSALRSIRDLEEGVLVSICGVVEEVDQRETGQSKSVLGVLIREGNYYLRALWFNQPYMRQRFKLGQRLLLAGTAKMNGGRWEMAHPQIEHLAEGAEPPAGRVLPVYPLTEGLSQNQVRRIAENVVETCAAAVPEAFPDELLRRGGGSSTRNCSCCNWPWPCGGRR
jgi:ATP-dependent DNA helicase RecG